MKFNLEEENKKKKKWKNGLSITPFVIHKDAGNVEKGIEVFNSAMNTGNSQGNISGGCQAVGEAIEAGQIEKAREIERDIQWYEEKEDDQPYNKDEYEAEIASLKQDLKENKMEFKHLHEVMKEDAFNLNQDHSLENLLDEIEVNAPYSREEEKPAAKELMINEINIPDNMRYKSWDADVIGDDTIQLDWTTQESFTSEDSEKFIAEIKRFFEALLKSKNCDKPLTIALEVMCRSLDEEDGHLVYDIKLNQKENEEMKLVNEDLNNVTEVEDKAKEVMDPTFASAVREIRSHDKGRAELKKLREAPKEGEESLPKDLKMNLDESLFTEWVENENLNEHLFHAKPGVYVNIEDERDWIKIGDNGKIHSVSSGEIINDGFGTKVNGTKYIVDAREGGPDRLYVYSYGDNGVDKSFPFVFKLSNRKIEEDAEFLNRIKSPVSDDVELSADMTLRDAYTAYEPEEFQLDRLRNDITLKEVWEKMKAGEDIYELASVDGKGFDSAVREGIFVMLEMVLGVNYDTIYNTWLHPEMKESCSKGMNESEDSDRINMTSEEYLEAVIQGGGWVTVEKIEFDTDYETIDVDDVLNKALASGWKFVNHPEHGLCIVAKGFEIKDE